MIGLWLEPGCQVVAGLEGPKAHTHHWWLFARGGGGGGGGLKTQLGRLIRGQSAFRKAAKMHADPWQARAGLVVACFGKQDLATDREGAP